jgi:hypothetical protein
MFDLDQTPIVLIGPKGMPLMMIAAGLVAMVVGMVVWSVTHIALIGGIVEPVGLWVLAIGIAMRKIGFRLTIAPEGLATRVSVENGSGAGGMWIVLPSPTSRLPG